MAEGFVSLRLDMILWWSVQLLICQSSELYSSIPDSSKTFTAEVTSHLSQVFGSSSISSEILRSERNNLNNASSKSTMSIFVIDKSEHVSTSLSTDSLSVELGRQTSSYGSVRDSEQYESASPVTKASIWTTTLHNVQLFTSVDSDSTMWRTQPFSPATATPILGLTTTLFLTVDRDQVTRMPSSNIHATESHFVMSTVTLEKSFVFAIGFRGNCSVLHSSASEESFKDAFTAIVANALKISESQVSYPKGIECGSVVVTFAVKIFIREETVSKILEELFRTPLNISIAGETFFSMAETFEEIFSIPSSQVATVHVSTSTPQTWRMSASISVAPSPTLVANQTRGGDLTILYAVVGSVVGLILIVVAIALLGFGKRAKKKEFNLHQMKYELGDFQNRSQAAMYGEATTTGVSSNRLEIGKGLPPQDLTSFGASETAANNYVKPQHNKALEEDE